jgi:hypothetical protein
LTLCREASEAGLVLLTPPSATSVEARVGRADAATPVRLASRKLRRESPVFEGIGD